MGAAASSSHVFLPNTRNAQIGYVTQHTPFLKAIRGGADATYFEGIGSEESDAKSSNNIPSVTSSDVEVLDTSLCDNDTAIANDKVGDNEMQQIDHDADNMIYATIGVLNVHTTSDEDGAILLSYKSNSNDPNSHQIIMHEKWGTTQSSEEHQLSNELTLAEINGCICHGIVLNLPILPTSESDEYLDNVLMCIAEGIIRRMKGIQQMSIPLIVTFDNEEAGEEEYELNNNMAKENTKRYIQVFLEQALCRLWKQLNTGDVQSTEEEAASSSPSSILEQCQVMVSVSDTSALETATQIATILLKESTDVLMKQNIVPQTLFGVLSKQIYNEIGRRRLGHGEKLAEWGKLSEDSQYMNEPTDKLSSSSENEGVAALESVLKRRPVSTDLKRKVESLMAMAFVDAEELLLEMEEKMDSAILDIDEVDATKGIPMPDFGSDADTIVGTISASFADALLDTQDEPSGSNIEYVNEQMIEALKQVVGTGICRLFHNHLQNLRDYFGQQYETVMDDIPLVDDGMSSEKDKYEWNQQRLEATRQAEEGFRKAAFGSIPQICQHPDGKLCNEMVGMFSCVEALRGLLEDIYDVTVSRGLDLEEWEDIMSTGLEKDTSINEGSSPNSRVGLRQVIKNIKAKVQKRGAAKWYERWALKALVIGINYVQGYIVLQSLRREARKRDREMPKFPLF